MQFGSPERLYLLLLVPLAIVFLALMGARARRALERFGSPALLERAGMSVSHGLRRLKAVMIVLALALMLFALAAPRWGATREKIVRKGVDVVVVLDTSKSMNAEDVAPSRLIKAKEAIVKLLDLMKGDRVAITVFAGDAYTLCPLTIDYNAARMFLDIIDVNIVPEPGTDIPAALTAAAVNFSKNSNQHKVIILISDGENLESTGGKDPAEVAGELAKQGVVIYTIGIGTSTGAGIPEERNGKTVQKQGRNGPVVTKLDENTLRKIALAGNGKYRRLDNQSRGTELADIYSSVAKMNKKTFDEDYQIHYEDRFQWFLGAALLLLVGEALLPDRRRNRS